MSDKNWDKMMSDWQSCKIANTDNQTALQDIQELEKKTRKKALSMNCFMWGDIIAAIALTVVFGYLLTQDIDIYKRILFAGSIILVIPMAIISVWFRKGAWKATGSDTKAYLELALKRSISAVRLANATAVFCIITGLFFTILVSLKVFSDLDVSNIQWIRLILPPLAQVLIFGSMFFGAIYYKKKKLLEKEKLQKMLNELS